MRRSRVALAFTLLSFLATACAYRAAPQAGLCRARTIRSKPFEGSRVTAADLEGLTFENGSDSLWIGDDNANQIYVVDSETGRFRARLRERDFLAAFPDAKACDNGSADVKCSYSAEFESLTYDRRSRSLYVVNTVNNLRAEPAVDKPAIYHLQSQGKGENLKFQTWKKLETGYKYGPIVVIDGQLYVTLGSELYAYDFDSNQFVATWGVEPEPVYRTKATIVGLAKQAAYLWVLTQDRTLLKVNWKTKEEEEHYDLRKLGLESAKGLAFGRGEFFLVEGDHPNPVYVMRFATAPKFSRARFLGGWPNSCPE